MSRDFEKTLTGEPKETESQPGRWIDRLGRSAHLGQVLAQTQDCVSLHQAMAVLPRAGIFRLPPGAFRRVDGWRLVRVPILASR